MANTKMIVLAGGKGTRLQPLTFGIPKILLPIKGVPMLDWVIRSALHSDIEEIVVGVPGTAGEDSNERMLSHIHGICIDSYLKNMDYGIKVRTVPTPRRETAGDLRYILEEIHMKKGKALVVYGDNLTQLDVGKLLEYHENCRNQLGVAGTVVLFEPPESELHRFGIAKLKNVSGFDIVESFIEKPTLQQAPSRFANAGYYVLETDEIFDILSREKMKVEHSLFPALASQNRLAGWLTKLPYWIDISTVQAYEQANKLAHEGLVISPLLKGEDNAPLREVADRKAEAGQ